MNTRQTHAQQATNSRTIEAQASVADPLSKCSAVCSSVVSAIDSATRDAIGVVTDTLARRNAKLVESRADQ